MKFELYAAKAEEKLKDIPDNSIDSCVHDGPYGIRFMGKAWDSFDIHIKGKKRDAQPSIERKESGRLNAGFGNSIEAGKYDPSANQKFQEWTTEIASDVYRVLKPGAYFLSFCSPRTFHRLVCGIEDAGFEIRDTLMWLFGSGFPKSHNLKGDWKGWGSALKPAFEPICMARKPLEKGLTIAENVKKWGTGAIYIDGCRIEIDELVDDARLGGKGQWKTDKAAKNVYAGGFAGDDVTSSPLGRWPANVIHDGSPEVVALFHNAPGQQGMALNNDGQKTNQIYDKYKANVSNNPIPRKDNSLSAARFFYVPKTSRADRNEGCENLDKKPLIWSSGTKNPGSFQSEGTDRSSQNNHPTVKPTELMQYLVRMVTPQRGVVLDHMCGSGSTGKACAIEDFDFIGIDEDPHNIEIARLRIQYIIDHKDLFGKFIRPK